MAPPSPGDGTVAIVPDGGVAGMVDAKRKSELILSTLDRGLHILEVLSGEGAARGFTLTELGQLLGMHRTTLFRFLATLYQMRVNSVA